ncbi:lipid-A-disaccharide synthase [Ramlibacter pallidus]|uniref:Lipid-A-disaccharide synthase n=1 Tax=Ramlibacter pallidus TaxID=2780087 RepID=A0ABR9S354_9BURK|nr:lipid-A-disaccharide synthase [Ramlibacter pallidus]MBE7367920.1 lipid-A-disaccharide synthase [Ramlibacter pallidus]
MSGPRAALVAGEASGDLLAGLLLQGMRQRWPGLQSTGIGGPQMARQGFQPQWPYEKLAVRGYVEVLRQYREIVGIRDQLRDRLLRERPDVFIGVDAPDFNLGLEEQLRKSGIPTVHFVCPSIWAWRMKRVEKLQRSCDHVLCVFPFEPELLARHGVAATYVGHPLASVIPMEPDKAAARTALGVPATGEVIALLPGSRASEVEAMAPRFLAAAAVLQQQRPGAWFVLPALPALQSRISQLARSGPSPRHLNIVTGQSHAALAACDVALVASGTATLEAALFKRPMVISYHTHWLTYLLMKPRHLQPWVGLPNILCGDFVVPELLQSNAKPRLLAGALRDWLDSPARMRAVREKFVSLHHTLKRDTAQLATDAIEKVLAA